MNSFPMKVFKVWHFHTDLKRKLAGGISLPQLTFCPSQQLSETSQTPPSPAFELQIQAGKTKLQQHESRVANEGEKRICMCREIPT